MRLDGVREILNRLRELDKKAKVPVLRAAIRGGLNVIGKQMKADLDPKVKLGRKAVKSRFKKGKWKIVAKVGFGVGPRNKKSPETKPRPKRGGVGMGPNNIHWWVAGTNRRETGRKRGKPTGYPVQFRGAMPAMQPGLARIAYAKSAGKVREEMIKRGALQLQKEVTKLQKVK